MLKSYFFLYRNSFPSSPLLLLLLLYITELVYNNLLKYFWEGWGGGVSVPGSRKAYYIYCICNKRTYVQQKRAYITRPKKATL